MRELVIKKRQINATRDIVYLALLVSIGLVLPSVFHIFGGVLSGKLFLPLHITPLITALVFGGRKGAFMGLVLPLVSSLITGMPPLSLLPFMMIELGIYGLLGVVGAKMPPIAGLAFIIIVGRIGYALVLTVGFYALGLSIPAPMAVITAFMTGVVGVIIQLCIIPPLVSYLRRELK